MNNVLKTKKSNRQIRLKIWNDIQDFERLMKNLSIIYGKMERKSWAQGQTYPDICLNWLVQQGEDADILNMQAEI